MTAGQPIGSIRAMPVPPLRCVARMLRATTETLAAELAAPTLLQPDWSDQEWLLARSVCAMHGISPLLAQTLRWPGPPLWHQFLVSQREHTFRRHQRIQELLGDIDAQWRRAGLPAVALKGAALHALGIYSAGERPMSDIDLLVRERDRESSFRLLEGLGYSLEFVTPKHWVFRPAGNTSCAALGEHFANPIKIELHTSARERLPLTAVDASPGIFPSDPHPGLNPYASTSALMRHLLLHAAGNTCFNGLRILHMNDIVRLSARMTPHDWERALATVDGVPSWWAYPPLQLTARYFGGIPAAVVSTAQSQCRWLLRHRLRRRKISDVSLSQVWIRAFPGLEWSASPLDMARYMVRRIVPDAETLAVRDGIRDAHEWIWTQKWSQLSQTGRIVGWLRRRPPRVETLSAINATWKYDA